MTGWRDVFARGLDLATEIGPLHEGDNILVITAGRWAMLDVVWHALEYTGHGSSFIGSSWGPKMSEAVKLRRMITTGAIGSIKLIIDGHAKVMNPGDILVLEQTVDPACIRMSHIHAKVIVLQGPAGSVVLASSMNWSRNPRIEQVTLAVDRQHAAEVAAEYGRMWEVSSTEWGAAAAAEAFRALDPEKRREVEAKIRKLRKAQARTPSAEVEADVDLEWLDDLLTAGDG